MHFSINVCNLKLWYQFKNNNLTYLDYDDDCSNNQKCDFKLKIVLGMW